MKNTRRKDEWREGEQKRAAVVRIQSGKWQACSPQEASSDEALLWGRAGQAGL